ncbi:MAG: ATP synthase F1 subunit delta [Candidatus Gastranaerophilales bacterium]|nr:ATP synthase F1 subunit delta [Candidatus Gastranaerophilales bacterium]
MADENLSKNITLAQRYTKALLQTAKENNSVEKIGNDLKEIINSFTTNPDIADFFTSPVIKKEDKKEILEKSFKDKIDEKLYNFLNVLADKNRMFLLPDVEYLYNQMLKTEANIIEVEVQSVIELDDDMNNQLKTKLQNMTGKTIELKHKINKDIIGGVILSYDGKVIDGSIKTQLKKLQMQLI